MLILTRKLGESIVIGEGPAAIKLTVVDIERGKVRLGCEAPKEIPIHRLEIHDRIQASKHPSPGDQGAA
jgi:carbon storage regulator